MTNKSYYRVILGRRNSLFEECYKGGYVGVDMDIDQDLTDELPDDWREFNKKYVPIYLKNNSDKTKVSAGLKCGMTWTLAKGMNIGDIILSPDGQGNYYIGEVTSDYIYAKGEKLQHRRNVKWFPKSISKDLLSESFRSSLSSIATIINVTKYSTEIEGLILGDSPVLIVSNDETVEDPSEFALEKHLEDFLVQNWRTIELGKKYDIYEVDGEKVGQQFPTDTGPIDILAISKNKRELLIVELKKGRATDVVVGQLQRYMGYVKDELAERDQSVKGVIIAFDEDIRLKRALSVANNIDFYTYKIHFKLEKK